MFFCISLFLIQVIYSNGIIMIKYSQFTNFFYKDLNKNSDQVKVFLIETLEKNFNLVRVFLTSMS